MSARRTLPGILQIIVALCLMTLLPSSLFAAPAPGNDTVRVLLVGNSIIYTNNLPAILTQMGTANEKHVIVDMLARGGAQVADHLATDKVNSAIRSGKYDVVVFHDRGGNALCAASSPLDADCMQRIDDHRRFVELIRNSGSIPYLLGTYQPTAASLQLTQGERYIADSIGISNIEISEKWNTAMMAVEDAPWLAEDGMHPGKALSTLMAMEIYRAIFGSYPHPGNLAIIAPLSVPRDMLGDIVIQHNLPTGDAEEILSAEQFEKILAVLKAADDAAIAE